MYDIDEIRLNYLAYIVQSIASTFIDRCIMRLL